MIVSVWCEISGFCVNFGLLLSNGYVCGCVCVYFLFHSNYFRKNHTLINVIWFWKSRKWDANRARDTKKSYQLTIRNGGISKTKWFLFFVAVNRVKLKSKTDYKEWIKPTTTSSGGVVRTLMPCIRDIARNGLNARSVRIVLNAWMPPAPHSEATKLINDT